MKINSSMWCFNRDRVVLIPELRTADIFNVCNS